MQILFIIIAIIAILAALGMLLWVGINVRHRKLDTEKGLTALDDQRAFTYKNILQQLGGLDNVKQVSDDYKIVIVNLSSLVKPKKLKKMGIRAVINNDGVKMTANGFNMKNFYKKLAEQLTSNLDDEK